MFFWAEVGARAFIEYDAFLNKGTATTGGVMAGEVVKQPSGRIPTNEVAGKIMELREDPAFEEKRKEAQRKYALGNTAHWKHGGKASYIAIECDNCYAKDKCKFAVAGAVCNLREDVKGMIDATGGRDKDKIIESLEGLYRRALERYYYNLYFEKLDGGVISKQVSALERSIFSYGELLVELIEGKSSRDIILGNKIVNTQVNVNVGKMLMKKDEEGKALGERLCELLDRYDIKREDRLPILDAEKVEERKGE
jgi:hypothetical protein